VMPRHVAREGNDVRTSAHRSRIGEFTKHFRRPHWERTNDEAKYQDLSSDNVGR
jgi:hypothetical protein